MNMKLSKFSLRTRIARELLEQNVRVNPFSLRQRRNKNHDEEHHTRAPEEGIKGSLECAVVILRFPFLHDAIPHVRCEKERRPRDVVAFGSRR